MYYRLSEPADKNKFTGYEKEEEGGVDLLHAGNRMYDPILGRFMQIDRFYDKYPNMSTYQYAANNPVNFIDVNGDSIWVTNENGVYTLHYQGKIINNSDKEIDMENASSEIAKEIKETLGGKITVNGEEVELNIEVDLQVANSMEDVASSDHLIKIEDLDYLENDGVGGNTPFSGSKTSLVNSDLFRSTNNPFNYLFGAVTGKGMRSTLHEIGHQLALKDLVPGGGGQRGENLMNSGGFLRGTNITKYQRDRIIINYNYRLLNKGDNQLPWQIKR